MRCAVCEIMKKTEHEGTAATALLPVGWTRWAGALLTALLLVAASLAALAALLFEHDRTARRAALAVSPSVRALEIENRELQSEIARLKLEMERRLYAASERTQEAAKSAPAVVGEAPRQPLSQRMRSPLLGKSFIRRAGL